MSPRRSGEHTLLRAPKGALDHPPVVPCRHVLATMACCVRPCVLSVCVYPCRRGAALRLLVLVLFVVLVRLCKLPCVGRRSVVPSLHADVRLLCLFCDVPRASPCCCDIAVSDFCVAAVVGGDCAVVYGTICHRETPEFRGLRRSGAGRRSKQSGTRKARRLARFAALGIDPGYYLRFAYRAPLASDGRRGVHLLISSLGIERCASITL